MTPHRLVLLRHAKAEPAGLVVDHDRPLALIGRRQASAVGSGLAASGLAPDLVLCSSALRTRQTWDLARNGLHAAGVGTERTAVVVTDALYDADVRGLVAAVGDVHDEVATVLVVGHEPTISQAAAQLAGPGSDPAALVRVRVGVPTGSWTVLELAGAWTSLVPASARLVTLCTGT
ncbi:SixA phosphatase family protein [Cellulomonas xiejunii]|uniref:SixA phosphatase family protein n=1 Tax=Cellulomonas xiejunii TaxID=2968083 RepID=UPI001D0E39B8|nr:histidine phosphatase family protein [Cellulomonas xiejunii]MCC2314656.1 histidine phosphatase family protein [Cellulomonas xiejunii]